MWAVPIHIIVWILGHFLRQLFLGGSDENVFVRELIAITCVF